MCGILVNYLKNTVIIPEKIKASLKLIQHRGPDEISVWVSPDKHIALGHVRLSILDVKNGAQPFTSEDQKLTAVINGEFYGWRNIREDLIKKGYVFKTDCDSEILLPLYNEYGDKCLDHLRGEFAFVIWDERKGTIFCARDRFGIKPLYYSLHNGNFYVASEIKSILALGIKAIWDKDTVYQSNHGIYQQEKTCFKEIFSVKPGYFLMFNTRENSLSQFQYWDFNYKNQSVLNNPAQEKEYIEQFREKIAEAVKVRLQSDVSYACYLSGGIDSTAVLALAAQLGNKKPDAFTISFPGKSIDELDLAKKSAEYIGSNHYFVDVSEQDIVDALPASIWHGESLVCNTHGVSLYLLSKLVNNSGHKVVLTGAGADETLCGYEFFREDVIRQNLKGHSSQQRKYLLDELRAASIAPGMTISEGKEHSDLYAFENQFGYIPALLSIYMNRGDRFKGFYNQDFLSTFQKVNPIDTFTKQLNLEKLKGTDILNLSSYMFSKSTLPGYILSTIGDKIEMAHSIEGRVPFLDHHLIEYAQTLPAALKINNHSEKYILRESLKDILPPWIYERKKQPFFSPESSGKLYEFMGEVLNSDILRNSPFYCQKSVLELYSNYNLLDAKNKISTDYILTEIMSSCLLEETFHLATE